MKNSSHSSKRHAAGFTLLEVLLAVAILGILLTTVYGAVSRTMRSKQIGEERAELLAAGREVVLRMADDIEGAMLPNMGDRFLFQGISNGGDPPMDEIRFVSMNRGGFGVQSVCPGPVFIAYALEAVGDRRDMLLLRRDQVSWQTMLNETDQTGTEVEEKLDELEEDKENCATQESRPLLYCNDFPGELKLAGSCIRVAGLRFRYYDPATNDFRTDWDSGVQEGNEATRGRLPAAVEISLYLMDERAHVEPFVTVVDIPLGVDQPTPAPGSIPGEEDEDENDTDDTDNEDGDEAE